MDEDRALTSQELFELALQRQIGDDAYFDVVPPDASPPPPEPVKDADPRTPRMSVKGSPSPLPDTALQVHEDNVDSQALFEQMLANELKQAVGGALDLPEELPDNVDLDTRLKHTKWDFRVHALKEIQGQWGQLELARTRPAFFDCVVRALSDRILAVQNASLSCLSALIEIACKELAESVFDDVASIIIEKVLTVPRAYPLAEALFLSITEVTEGPRVVTFMVDFVNGHLDKKGNPAVRGPAVKRVHGALSVVYAVLKTFSVPVIGPKTYIGCLGVFVSTTDKKIREKSWQILKLTYASMPSEDFMRASIRDPKLAAELMQQVQTNSERAEPATRHFKSLERQSARSERSSTGTLEVLEIDAWECVEEKEAINGSTLPSLEKKLKECEKWSERRDALDALAKELKRATRLAVHEDYVKLLQLCSRVVVSESNQAVIRSALTVVLNILKGLRKNVGPAHMRLAMECVRAKLKDRMKSTTSVAYDILVASLLCTGVDHMMDDIVQGVADKVIQVRRLYFAFILEAFNTQMEFFNARSRCLARLVKLGCEGMQDSSKDVRDAALEFLAAVQRTAGHAVMEAQIAEIPTKKQQQIRIALEKRLASATVNSPPQEKPRSPKRVLRNSCNDQPAPAKFDLSYHVAEERLATAFPERAAILEGIQASTWKEKSQGLAALTESWQPTEDRRVLLEALVFVMHHSQEVRHVNINVNKAGLAFLAAVAEWERDADVSLISEGVLRAVLIPLRDRLSDPKLGGLVFALFVDMAKINGAKVVCRVILEYLQGIKNAKCISVALNLLDTLLLGFGPRDCPIHLSTPLLMSQLESTDPAVRAAAAQLTGSLLRFAESRPATHKALTGNVELKPIVVEGVRTCSLSPLHSFQIISKASSSEQDPAPLLGSVEVSDDDSVDNIVCLMSVVSPTKVKAASDPTNWKTRRTALQDIASSVSECGRVRPQKLGEIIALIKTRVLDSNRTVAIEALNLAGTLATALGPSGANTHAQSVVPAILPLLSNPRMREAVQRANCAWVDEIGVVEWLRLLIARRVLQDATKAELREALLMEVASDQTMHWDCVNDFDSGVLEHLIQILLGDYVQDRSANVRMLTEVVLEKISVHSGPSTLKAVYDQLNPEKQRNVSQVMSNLAPVEPPPQNSSAPSLEPRPARKKPPPTAASRRQAVKSSVKEFSKGLSGKPIVANAVGRHVKSSKWDIHLTTEDVLTLQGQLKPQLNVALQAHMFERNRAQLPRILSTIEFWIEWIHSMSSEEELSSFLDVVDLLFKWIAWRLQDEQLRLVNAVIDLLSATLSMFKSDGVAFEYQLGQVETEIVVPHLLHQICRQHDQNVCARLEECLGLLPQICDATCMCHLLLNNCSRKKGRSQYTTFATLSPVTLCLRHVAHIIDVLGLEPLGDLLVDDVTLQVAGYMSNKYDEEVRNAAAFAFCTIISFLPDEKQLTLVDECDSTHVGVRNRMALFLENNPSFCNEPSAEGSVGDSDQSELDMTEIDIANRLRSEVMEREMQETLDLIRGHRETSVKVQSRLLRRDLLETWRRDHEGMIGPKEVDIAYFVGIQKMNEARELNEAESLVIDLEIRKLFSPDMQVIRDGAQRLNFIIGQYGLNNESTLPAALSSELLPGCASALATCFSRANLSTRGSQSCATAKDVACILELFVRNKRVLLASSPRTIQSLYLTVMKCMSCHSEWAENTDDDRLVSLLNSVVGTHMMAVVSPATAYRLLPVVFEFVLFEREECYTGANHPNSLLDRGIDTNLAFRVLGRFLKKFNGKHPSPAPRLSVFPPKQEDQKNYARLLDVAFHCLRILDAVEGPRLDLFQAVHADFGELASTDLVNHQEDLRFALIENRPFVPLLQREKEMLEAFLREVFYIACTVSPVVAGVYFRDKGISTNTSATSLYLKARLEALMNELGKSDLPDYFALHRQFLEHSQVLTTPLRGPLPPFQLDDFVEHVPADFRLLDIDGTLAHGWAERRSQLSPLQQERGMLSADLWPSTQLLVDWRVRLDRSRKRLGMPASKLSKSLLLRTSKASDDTTEVLEEAMGELFVQLQNTLWESNYLRRPGSRGVHEKFILDILEAREELNLPVAWSTS